MNGNKNAPTILWLNGGPGESSIGTGLFELMGPYKVNDNLELEKNPYTWNKENNLLFVDQPAGTGFSYTDPKGYVYFYEQACTQLLVFLDSFFREPYFMNFQANDLYIGGESYGGKWVPSFNHALFHQTKQRYNVKGLLLLNPFTDPLSVYQKCSDSMIGFGLLNEERKEEMDYYCEQMVESVRNGSLIESFNLFNFIDSEYIPKEFGVCSMNILKDPDCYDFSNVDEYVNLPNTRTLMNTANHTFNHSSMVVYNNFKADFSRSVIDDVIEALDQMEIKVMFLVGQFDWECGTMATENTLRNMKWANQKEFNLRRSKPIYDEQKKIIAFLTQFKNLNYVVIRNAGHLSPLDKPASDYQIIQSFIKGTL